MRLGFIKKKFSIYGGAERYLQTLIENLKQEGHEIHIFANQWSYEKDIIFHKVNILPFSSFLSTLTFNISAGSTVKSHQSRFYDCVISFERVTCQDIYRAGEGCHKEWLKIRSRIEPFYKNFSFKINPLHISLLRLEKRLFMKTPFIIANSEMVKKQIMQHYPVAEERIETIYNGVDLKRFSPENKYRWRGEIRQRFGISDSTRVLLFVGSGFERKGLKTLIDAVSLIRKEDIKVFVVGKGNAEKYKSLNKKSGISNKIRFLGVQKDIEKFYAASDLFILPTIYDPFSNATLEAMASGVPVITTKNNGVAELIADGRGGLIMDSLFDAHELSDKISLSFKHLMSTGEEARKKAMQFPIEKAVREFEEVINQVLKKQKPI